MYSVTWCTEYPVFCDVSFRTGNDPWGQFNTPSLHAFHLPHYRLICSCSIGNFFFAGARIFFQSLDAAIFLFSRVSQIPAESLVLPVISTNDRLTLGCELWDGTIIRGQNEISHPSNGRREVVTKDCNSCTALPSRIKRVFYMSSEGSNLLHEVGPHFALIFR
jgi:hypothetical protein